MNCILKFQLPEMTPPQKPYKSPDFSSNQKHRRTIQDFLLHI